jgi:hypothetical protein
MEHDVHLGRVDDARVKAHTVANEQSNDQQSGDISKFEAHLSSESFLKKALVFETS